MPTDDSQQVFYVAVHCKRALNSLTVLRHSLLLASSGSERRRRLKQSRSKSSENLPLSPGVFIFPNFGYVAAVAKICYTREGRFHRRWNVKKKVCPSLGLLLGSPTVESSRRYEATKTFVASAQRGLLRFSSSALAARPLPVSLSPLSARGRAIQRQPSRNTVPARAALASLVVRGAEWGEKFRRKKNGREFPVKASRGRRKAVLTTAKLPSLNCPACL